MVACEGGWAITVALRIVSERESAWDEHNNGHHGTSLLLCRPMREGA